MLSLAGIAEEPKWRFRLDEPMRMALWRASEIEDKRSDLTIEKQYVLHEAPRGWRGAVQHLSKPLAVVRRELEKATTRTHNREKPYSAKAARKTLYERVSDPMLRMHRRGERMSGLLTIARVQILELWPPGGMSTNQLSRESEYSMSTRSRRFC